MNDPASPPSLDLGFSVEPPPLPDFDCTVDLDFDPAFARHVLERQFARLGFTNRNLIVLLVGSLVVAGFFHANPLASPVASVLAFLAAVLLFLRHRLVREAGNPRPSFSGKHRLHLTSNRYAVATEGYRMEIDWGKLAKTYFETDDAIVLLRGVSVATAFGPRVFAAAGRERLRSVLEAAGVRRHPGKRWTQASWVLWILAAFTVFCVFSSPRPDTPGPAEEKHAESAESAEPEPHAAPDDFVGLARLLAVEVRADSPPGEDAAGLRFDLFPLAPVEPAFPLEDADWRRIFAACSVDWPEGSFVHQMVRAHANFLSVRNTEANLRHIRRVLDALGNDQSRAARLLDTQGPAEETHAENAESAESEPHAESAAPAP